MQLTLCLYHKKLVKVRKLKLVRTSSKKLIIITSKPGIFIKLEKQKGLLKAE